MIPSFEDTGKLGKELIDTGLRSAAALSIGAQAIAVEAVEYTRRSIETGSVAVGKLIASTSLDAAVAVQSEFARSAYGAFVSEATRMGELYADMTRDACKPFETVVARAR